MKLLAIVHKDLRRSFRSLFAIVFMFVIPLLVTALFAIMFSGLGGEDEAAFTLPPTTVQVVNLDEGQVPDEAGNLSSLGAQMVTMLQAEELSGLMAVTVVADAEAARAAVARGETGVALIIPPDFTAALTTPEREARLDLYQDPALTIGPDVVASVARQMVDRLAATSIGVGVTVSRLAAAGIRPDSALIGEALAASHLTTGAALVDVTRPDGAVVEDKNVVASILALIMGGMTVFYAFFTGASSLETILTEEEEGTLPRLFTTPTPRLTILAGKLVAVVVILSVQVTVLFLAGAFVFGIDWGAPLPVALVAAGLVLIAVATGLFLISLLQNRRQSGTVFGGVLTVTGMLGMVPIFTAGQPANPAMNTVALLVPQGWAVHVLRQTLDGAGVSEVLPFLGGILLWSLAFLSIGVFRLRRRFA